MAIEYYEGHQSPQDRSSNRNGLKAKPRGAIHRALLSRAHLVDSLHTSQPAALDISEIANQCRGAGTGNGDRRHPIQPGDDFRGLGDKRHESH